MQQIRKITYILWRKKNEGRMQEPATQKQQNKQNKQNKVVFGQLGMQKLPTFGIHTLFKMKFSPVKISF